MISINDFVPGERVYLLEAEKSRGSAPVLRDAVVRRIRNGYVWVSETDDHHSKSERTFCRRGSEDCFLTEEDQIGWGVKLFRYMEDAETDAALPKAGFFQIPFLSNASSPANQK